MDLLARIMLDSPKFDDESGYFPGRNIDTTFFELDEGLKGIRDNLTEECYNKLLLLSGQMRKHFEADPNNETNDTLKGRALIHEMEVLIGTCQQAKRAKKEPEFQGRNSGRSIPS